MNGWMLVLMFVLGFLVSSFFRIIRELWVALICGSDETANEETGHFSN